ncbi:hypothetical protein RHGRI_008735 [Rhododendron griersonianum]|uniref:3'-5' exonuclease domain-containing protein n=1 Tax=Rhododendron griersonianum TaxID=479676 RepID=A0AAV6L1D6_9ERIC|nr:hypothetical protein RHGRI_008735 [Rhododendron griersonianum]
MEAENHNPPTIYSVSSVDSPEFTHFTRALTRSSVIGLDAEWKPLRVHQPTFPTVSLVQIACRSGGDESSVFLLDLFAIPLPSIYGLLKDVFVSPDVLKLGFRFKQDLVYLSSTFCSQGCDPGFDRVEPFLDITSIYNYLQHKQLGRKIPKQIKSLATICEEVLGISLSKELQCSDWSCRPLTAEQKAYAAEDAHCLLEIFKVFQIKVSKEEDSFGEVTELSFSHLDLGLKEILEKPNSCDKILRTKFSEALEIVRATTSSESSHRVLSASREVPDVSCMNTIPMDGSLLQIVQIHGDKILLKESDRKPKTSRKKGKRKPSEGLICKERPSEKVDDWQGLPPWDLSLGGDGCPKFLCDVMVEGLAKHLRCVGIDAAVPYSKKPETRRLIDQAQREKRVLLTRDVKLLRHEYLLENQIYRVKSLLKNEQLLEVIETFQLKISEDHLMSRCTKCNGSFIQKPLTTEEAVEAAKGFQVIPNCLFNKNLEFWQCMDCNQLYWEGTQYHNAVQKFIDVCKLNA